MQPCTFSEKLLLARKRKSWTHADLSRVSGLSIWTLSRLERGDSKPSWEDVQALSGALGVPVEEFRDEPPNAPESAS